MPITATDRDMMIRTIMGEAQNEPPIGQAAVAHVILNRMATGKWGDNPTSVVKAKGQFEPWATRRKELEGYDPKSPAYQKVAGVVDATLAGQVPDPTGGATHFLEPTTVRRRRGGSLPDWAQGPGLQIGHHAFYLPPEMQNVSRETLAGKPQDAIASALGFLDKPGNENATLPFAATAQGAPAPASNLADEWLKAHPETETPAAQVQERFPGQGPPDLAGGKVADDWLKAHPEEAPAKVAAPAAPQELPPPQSAGERLAADPLFGTEFLNPIMASWQGKPGIGPAVVRHGLSAVKGIGNLGESVIEGIGGLGQLVASHFGYGDEFKKQRKDYEKRVTAGEKEFEKGQSISESLFQAAPAVAPFLMTRGKIASPQIASAVARMAPRFGPTALKTAEAAGAGALSSAAMSSRSETPLGQQMAEGALFAGGLPLAFKGGATAMHALHGNPLGHALGYGLAAIGLQHYEHNPEALIRDLQLAGAAAVAAGAGKAGLRWPGAVGAAAGPQAHEILSPINQLFGGTTQ